MLSQHTLYNLNHHIIDNQSCVAKYLCINPYQLGLKSYLPFKSLLLLVLLFGQLRMKLLSTITMAGIIEKLLAIQPALISGATIPVLGPKYISIVSVCFATHLPPLLI